MNGLKNMNLRVLMWCFRIFMIFLSSIYCDKARGAYDLYQTRLNDASSAMQASQISGEYTLMAVGDMTMAICTLLVLIVAELAYNTHIKRKATL